MWNGAGSVSPAGKACDWVGPCHCDSCVAKRGYIVPRTAESEAAKVLASHPPGYVQALIEAENKLSFSKLELYQRRVELYRELFDKYRDDVAWHADWARRMWGGQ